MADGDEFTLYQTDPTIADTDGDGALDGEELFGTHTDPLLWDNGTTTSSEYVAEPAPESAPVAETATVAEATEPVAADTAPSDKEAAYAEGDTTSPPEGTTENLSATSAGAAPLSGTSLLGPDGTYRVTESSPPIITVSGVTTSVSVVPAPGIEAAPATVAEPSAATETVEPEQTEAPVESAEPVAAEAPAA